MRSIISITLIVTSLLCVSCSSPPTEADLTSAILEAAEIDPDVTLTNAEAACIADILITSELSDVTLNGLAANFTQPEVLEDEAEILEPLVAGAAQLCLADSEEE